MSIMALKYQVQCYNGVYSDEMHVEGVRVAGGGGGG